jgi:transcription-repair coupling factor (superfamily II helicase)
VNAREIIAFYAGKVAYVPRLQSWLDEKHVVQFNGYSGSFKSIVAGVTYEFLEHSVVFLAKDEESALYAKQDLETFLEQEILFLPESFRKPYHLEMPESNRIQERSEVLLHLEKIDKPVVLVTTVAALAEKVISPAEMERNKWDVQIKDKVDLEFMLDMFQTYGFEREDFVYEPGQFAIRGGIIDVFSFSADHPYRIELDGLEVESIRQFDPISQLSIKDLHFITVVPNVQDDRIASEKISFTDYLKNDVAIFAEQLDLGLQVLQKSEDDLEEFENYFDSRNHIKKWIKKHGLIHFGQLRAFRPHEEFDPELSPQKAFGKSMDLLNEHLQSFQKLRAELHIFSESGKQIERLDRILEDIGAKIEYAPVFKGLSSGFADVKNKVVCYTEHEIFGRHYQYKSKRKFSKNQALTLKDVSNLKPGDFVVHIDHGVGVFQGLQKIEMGGRLQEAVRLKYKNEDLLYVNIGSLHKISRYTGKEGATPKVNKLGSDAWVKLKSKTKKKVKDIARDLIKLYAKRKAAKGHQFLPDNYLQVELEASFMYEDTPDQSKAAADVKADMETPHPMDRLVCGDVGFGKTEVAVRAAFKAVCDSKQVAVLVPTTILAQQHYHTFRKRLEGFPVKVDYINRFRTSRQQTQSIKDLADGKTDIIIGTHKLLGSKIKFKDLGLLIIDEEQKFGVSAKEKLKNLRVNVDTLTLTATPIPRTLHFSLMGARDLSIINTPPPNRQPVTTTLHTFDKSVFVEAITEEMNRGGQVFVVHNRVRDIQELAAMIRDGIPHCRVAVGHGQMAGDEMENVMFRFIEGEYDVLVATTIIESGLDIPNANTIIINNAHFFGLSDLHQMRGRVGRSNRKAYCHLITPPLHTLTDEARRRLQAIEEFSELGSGFNVAMRDLDIRGAGNLLGGEQSGFISEIGFDMYHKILDEAVQELQEEEFADLFDQKKVPEECIVDTDLNLMLPDSYVTNISERLSLYTELANVKDKKELKAFEESLVDRFGKMPRPVKDLLESVELKFIGQMLGIQRVRIKANKMILYFPDEKHQDYFQSERFGQIMNKINAFPRFFTLKQKQNQLYLVVTPRGNKVEDYIHAMIMLV